MGFTQRGRADSLIALEKERRMGRPYSQDLRERVVEAAATTSRRQAAARFGVGVATSIRWMAALTMTGTAAARPQGRAPLEARSVRGVPARPDRRKGRHHPGGGAGPASGRARSDGRARHPLDVPRRARSQVQKRIARPICKRHVRGDLTGLRQRIRSRGRAPAKIEFRTPWSS